MTKIESAAPKPSKVSFERIRARMWKDRFYYFMFLPVFIIAIIFSYIPMIGITNAFYTYTPFMKEFIGFENFVDLFVGLTAPMFWNSLFNTLRLSFTSLILATVFTVFYALLMNELKHKKFKSFVQTALYLPHFLSWVVCAGIFLIILSPQFGIVNIIMDALGLDKIYFLGDERYWTPTYYFIVRWRETGYGTIIFMAALSGISPEYYEAAQIDGAGRLRQTLSITLPSIATTIVVVFVLNLAKILNLFDSVYVLQNPNVYHISDTIATYTYRSTLKVPLPDYGMGTAIGLFRSFIGLFLVLLTDKIAKKIQGESLL